MGRGVRCGSARVAGLAALLRPGATCWVRQEHAAHPLFAEPEAKPVVSPRVHDPFDAARPDANADTLYGRTNHFVREVGPVASCSAVLWHSASTVLLSRRSRSAASQM